MERLLVSLAVGTFLCAAGCTQPRPVTSPGLRFENRDCGFRMVPDAGGCEIWIVAVFSGREEDGGFYGGIGDGHELVGCGERIDVCGGLLACDCPPDAGDSR